MSDPRPTSSAPASGPRGLPLIGSTLSFAHDPVSLLESNAEYGDVVRYEAFGRDLVAFYDPGHVEQVLVSRSDEFWRGEFEHEFSDVIDIEGVLFAEGDEWKRQRLMLQSAFTPDMIRTYADAMVDETVRAIDGWADGEVVDLEEELSALTLAVLARSLFDLELDEDRGDRVRRWVHAMSEYTAREVFGAGALLPAWVPSRTAREFDRATADVRSLVEELVAERRASGADGNDLLTLLSTGEYPDGTSPSSEEIGDQLMTFLLAGHETTATALTYACWLLAGDDGTRERLESELETVCGDRDPTFADLPDLAVTEAIGREAMRLYPPLPFLHREPHEVTSVGGHRISPGTTVQLPMYAIHRDERWWDDSDEFRPGRWLEGDGSDATVVADPDDRPEYAYFPFGGGPRHCIGMRFAMTELQLTLATLARRVDLERVTESVETDVGITLDPGLVEMRVRKR
ncbi:cytochrome P450 [Natrarchaeobius oligotrophus]|uniref:Cytochrome P450 n=1 Tax=Natrarchaeobius chitinivorans TaxID=1679083 RepID=A0A3N6N0M4_NATCH|nr:cytochrome P450 [Natrarchaeobius chitinivorans]RQH01017.1 cytochrome P450 [Natrarchaeobius chitinivorans]